MGVDVIICLHCGAPTLLDLVGSAASAYAFAMLVISSATLVPRLRTALEELQLLAYSSGSASLRSAVSTRYVMPDGALCLPPTRHRQRQETPRGDRPARSRPTGVDEDGRAAG